MANEQFSLCWDNFHTNMSSGLSSLLKSEDLVDVTLAVDGRYIKAHKMILSVCSPYFKELFQVNPCKHPIVFLKDVSYVVISSLLEFMYQGEVKVSQDILGTFIKTAESLQIKGLTGDASSQSEAEPEAASTPVHNNVPSTLPSDSSITLTRRSTREKTPPRKKMLGPLSKRFKPDTDYTHSPAETEQSTSETLQMEPQMANELVVAKNLPPLAPLTTFKLEPEETAVSLANEEDMTYDDSAMDDMGMDNTADYLMESHEDAKAGTSSEVANAEVPGENQESTRSAIRTASTTSRSSDPDLDKLLMLCCGIQSFVQSIDTRLNKLETKQPEQKNKIYDFLNKSLPINSEEEVKHFEKVLDDKEKKDVFVHYIQSIGGRTPKDSINRILRQVYTNEFGVHCSWLGQRNNIRMCNTKIINLIQEVIMPMHDMTLHEFETYASAWFRFSRIRMERKSTQQ